MKSTKSGIKASSPQPLLNDVVLKEILKYSSVKDLKCHRLVCRKWYHVSLPKWRSESTVKVYLLDSCRPVRDSKIYTQLYDGMSVKSLLSLKDKEEKTEVSGFRGRKTVFQSVSKPFEKYCFIGWDFSKALNAESLEFFTRLGLNMKSITLDKCVCDTLNQSESILRFTPNLEQLSFQNPRWLTFRDTFLVTHIFNVANQEIRLKHLDLFSDGYFISHYYSLQQNNPHFLSQLESLHIPAHDRSPRATIDVVELYKETLKHLTLCMDSIHEAFPALEFTQDFENLRELEILGPVTKSLSFLKWMPNLEKILLKQYYSVFKKVFEQRQRQRQGTMPTLVVNIQDVVLLQMHTLWTDVELDWSSLKNLKNCTPNLRRLSMKLISSSFIAVSAFWPNLKEVRCLFGSDLDDWGLIPNVVDIVDKERLQNAYEGKEVGITALKGLEKFCIEGFNGIGKLTDLSAEEGFLKLNNLAFLSICVSKQFSLKMITKLKAKIFSVTVVRKSKHDKSSRIE